MAQSENLAVKEVEIPMMGLAQPGTGWGRDSDGQEHYLEKIKTGRSE